MGVLNVQRCKNLKTSEKKEMSENGEENRYEKLGEIKDKCPKIVSTKMIEGKLVVDTCQEKKHDEIMVKFNHNDNDNASTNELNTGNTIHTSTNQK